MRSKPRSFNSLTEVEAMLEIQVSLSRIADIFAEYDQPPTDKIVFKER